MKLFHPIRHSLPAAVCLASLLPCLAQAEERLGEVDFPISCSAEAQKQFNRGVALLHSFAYPETVKAFSELADKEPDCAMAYWGVAISQRPNPLVSPFPDENLRDGWRAIQRARAAAQKTERETAWIEALAPFFEGYETTAQGQRTARYEAAMARLVARYPEDVEASIFHALALNEAADPTDRTYAKQLQAAALLEKLESKYPNHPGIPHYIIHSYDYPALAIRGVIAATRCAEIAASAPHALHMPSHIFSTIGMWHEAIQSDLAADRLVMRYSEGDDPSDPHQVRNPGRYHTFDFLINAYLQLGEDRRAKAILDGRNTYGDSEFPAYFRYTGHTAFAAIPVRYAFERSAWSEAATLAVARTIWPQAEAISWFGRSVGAARTGDLDRAKQAADHLRILREKLAAAGDAYWAGQVTIQEKAAAAWIALRERRRDDAIASMREAADLEDRSGKHVAMENRLSPMREMLGELLLEANDAAAALKEFEASLRDYPNRYRSFAGAARAAERSLRPTEAKTYYQKLVALAADGDGSRPDLVDARRYLAQH